MTVGHITLDLEINVVIWTKQEHAPTHFDVPTIFICIIVTLKKRQICRELSAIGSYLLDISQQVCGRIKILIPLT